MNKIEYIKNILMNKPMIPAKMLAQAYAPSNIALVKYWGKRHTELNLPVTSSLSISLANKGAFCKLSISDVKQHCYSLNGKDINQDSNFAKRLQAYLNLFIPADLFLQVETSSNIPIAAGLASSACGFAAITKALNELFNWQLDNKQLSMLARLGSGSAARSLWDGFVYWHAGKTDDGIDCYAELLPYSWPNLRVGLLLIDETEKMLSSREAMQFTMQTSPFYVNWPTQVDTALQQIIAALQAKDFNLFGQIAEANALAMHATMLTAWPPILYWQAETVTLMQKIWQLRKTGLPLYFTQDAGPNLKLLFLAEHEIQIKAQFPNLEIVKPFNKES